MSLTSKVNCSAICFECRFPCDQSEDDFSYGWEFLFFGANIDAVETARHFGIGADRAVNYHSDSAGTQLNYEVQSEAISAVRCSAPLGADWKRRIDEDYEKRGKGKKK